jgi:hypothetical protein
MGLALLALLYALGLYRLWRNRSRSQVPIVAAFLGFACYMSLTQVHETYAFSVLPFLALALPFARKWRIVYAVLSLTFLANMCLHDAALLDMMGVLEQEWLLGPLKYVNALVNVGVFVYWIMELIPRRSLRRDSLAASLDERQAT